MRVAVIGAGISGLAAAWHIRRLSEAAGFRTDISVFEKSALPGGKIGTSKQEGYLLEAGPNGFLDGKKAALELASSLGLEGRLERADRSSARRYIYDGRRL
ncbi:MAG TPA: FAD-dependent oxidoreductase, partial [Elusimicrobiales bacterium]|nr:FAD-dependent oxidoreductase [Elusimicrobiales bacterium]